MTHPHSCAVKKIMVPEIPSVMLIVVFHRPFSHFVEKNVKVKFSLEQATQALTGSRCIPPLFL
jgi:hypothetical protein